MGNAPTFDVGETADARCRLAGHLLRDVRDLPGLVFREHNNGRVNTRRPSELLGPLLADVYLFTFQQADVRGADSRSLLQLFLSPPFQVTNHADHLARA